MVGQRTKRRAYGPTLPTPTQSANSKIGIKTNFYILMTLTLKLLVPVYYFQKFLFYFIHNNTPGAMFSLRAVWVVLACTCALLGQNVVTGLDNGLGQCDLLEWRSAPAPRWYSWCTLTLP